MPPDRNLQSCYKSTIPYICKIGNIFLLFLILLYIFHNICGSYVKKPPDTMLNFCLCCRKDSSFCMESRHALSPRNKKNPPCYRWIFCKARKNYSCFFSSGNAFSSNWFKRSCRPERYSAAQSVSNPVAARYSAPVALLGAERCGEFRPRRKKLRSSSVSSDSIR